MVNFQALPEWSHNFRLPRMMFPIIIGESAAFSFKKQEAIADTLSMFFLERSVREEVQKDWGKRTLTGWERRSPARRSHHHYIFHVYAPTMLTLTGSPVCTQVTAAPIIVGDVCSHVSA